MAVITALTYFVLIFSVFLLIIFLLQIYTEPKECPKVPHFLHRTGPWASIGLIGYALINFEFVYSSILIVNLNQSFLLFILNIVALYVVDTMKTIHRLKLNKWLFILIYLIGLLNVFITALSVGLRLGINQWWPQLISICYSFFSVNLSWIFLLYSYYRIMRVMVSIDKNYRSHLYKSQMKTLKASVIIISLICIAVAIYTGRNIYLQIKTLDRTDARNFDTSILLFGFLIQMFGVLVVLWYGWTPFKKDDRSGGGTSQKKTTQSSHPASRPETPGPNSPSMPPDLVSDSIQAGQSGDVGEPLTPSSSVGTHQPFFSPSRSTDPTAPLTIPTSMTSSQIVNPADLEQA